MIDPRPASWPEHWDEQRKLLYLSCLVGHEWVALRVPVADRRRISCVNGYGNYRSMPADISCNQCGISLSTRMPSASAPRPCHEVLIEAVLKA